MAILIGCSSEEDKGATSNGDIWGNSGWVPSTENVVPSVGGDSDSTSVSNQRDVGFVPSKEEVTVLMRGTVPTSASAFSDTGGASNQEKANNTIAGGQSPDTDATVSSPHERDSQVLNGAMQPAENKIKFAVFSDPHYYDTDLGTSGLAFDTYVTSNRKLLAESPAILESAIDEMRSMKDKLDFVIVSGDLTKDGERTSHEKFIMQIRALEESGIEVYVCPGNHDINNPNAASYQGDVTTKVDNISPEQFAELYADFGFQQAIDRDVDSLSYVVEPVSGLWVIAIDSCVYKDNLWIGISAGDGALSESTLSWIEEKIAEAKQMNKQVIGFMHHGLVEHFTDQSALLMYLINDWLNVSQRLSQSGLKLVFTGHFHAQDITRQHFEGNDLFIYDVETGSLVTFPHPYRIVTLDAYGRAEISSRFIQSIAYDTGGLEFPEYSREVIASGFEEMVDLLQIFGIPKDITEQMKPVVSDTLIEHYSGDEAPNAHNQHQVEAFVNSNNLLVSFIGVGLQSLQTDLEPADNHLVFNIESGEVE